MSVKVNSSSDVARLVEAAVELIPVLAERADAAESLRRLPDETIDDLEAAGLLGIRTPARYGGAQAPAEVVMQVAEALATGCASTSFVATVYQTFAAIICLLPDEAQEDFFAAENRRGFLSFNPGGGADPVDGGFKLSGRWPFASGQHHAGWGLVSAALLDENGNPDMGFFLLPRSAFSAADDWQVTGLAATGSNTVKLESAFVPATHVMLLSDLIGGRSNSTLVKEEPYYQKPLLPFALAGFAGTPIGVAKAALDQFRGRVGKRAITYTTYFRQAEATVTQLQMAEATIKLDQARFHVSRMAQATQLPFSAFDLETRARVRADLAWAIRLCREVTDIVQSGSGASAIHKRDPLQRIIRDMQALSVHSLFLFSTNAELYGQILCGIDPGNPLV